MLKVAPGMKYFCKGGEANFVVVGRTSLPVTFDDLYHQRSSRESIK
jgi:hypothetical protein